MTNYSYTNMNFNLTAAPNTCIEFRTNRRMKKQMRDQIQTSFIFFNVFLYQQFH
ncbi:hypothetical protein LDENG_00170340 [Lucifuga dentata]|nr:hypothetical protein LDENG_00170340 [Lucifuga dentata]